ncbi:MAG TPA: hypothetical protein VEK08_24695 [Planctomycetota bacterium]|nr:hypothetical protein [Planctomycetota bacterium]
MHIPFFVEAGNNAECGPFSICRKVSSALLAQRIFPLPFAATTQEAAQVSSNLAKRGMTPGVFIVNTYLAEPLLNEVEKFMGSTPVLLLRRSTNSHLLTRKKDLLDTTVIMKKMDGRQTMLCPYDNQNALMVAEQVADCLTRFVRDGDFWHFARLSVLSISTLDP